MNNPLKAALAQPRVGVRQGALRISRKVTDGRSVLTVSVPIIKILTGRPFQSPRKPILPYILVIAWPAPSPGFRSEFSFDTITSAMRRQYPITS